MIGVIVLAAGSSTRMGRPKLLLPLRGKSLVRRVTEEALASRADRVLIVTGAYREAIERELAGLPIRAVHNQDHLRGISTSLRAGLRALPPEAEAALVVLADQPLVDRTVLDALIEQYLDSGAAIVQPTYGGQPGNPVLWDRRLFGELMAQEGDRGGREILRRRAGEIARCELDDPRVQQDVDTPEAYEALRASVEEGPPILLHEHGADGVRFCPKCAGRLEGRTIEGRSRPFCGACGSVYWEDPKVAVAVCIPWDGGVLLGRRAIDPGLGLWSFPSGYVDRGEVLEDAARREVLEESGLAVDIAGLVGVYSTPGNPVVLVVYAAEATSGCPEPGPEVGELAAFPPDRLPPMAFEHDDRIIRDWITLRAGSPRSA